MLYKKIITFNSQIHTKHISTLCGQNVGLLNVNLGSERLIKNVVNIAFSFTFSIPCITIRATECTQFY